MEVQTLGALKAQNAKEVGEETEESVESVEVEETETEEEAETEAVENTEDVEEEADETEETAETEESEAWQAAEEQDSEGSQPRMFSASEIAIARRKERAKAKKRVDDELAQLREENAKLKQGTATVTPPQTGGFSKPRPKRDDFPYGDDSAYEAALDAWQDERLEAKLANVEQRRQQQHAVSAETRAIGDAVQKHDERAAELIAKGAISAKAFVEADAKVREALEQATPELGDVADRLIAQIGDGSEKLFVYLGRNPTALNVLRNKMVADPTGLQAMLYLGELRAEKVATMRQTKSNAPKPGKKLKGDVAGGSAGALQRKYNAAKDPGDRIRLKRQAKAGGVDTSNW